MTRTPSPRCAGRPAPWRLSRLLAVPERGAVVTPDQLRALSQKPAPAARPGQNGSGANDRSFDLHELLDRLGIGYVQDLHEGTERYRLEHCPFNPDHGCGEAAIFRGPDGRLGFKCQHNSCADRHWHDVRELVDGPRDRRAAPGGGSDAQTYARLAKLTPAEYDRVREAEAKALGIRSATLDAGVRRLRSGTDEPRAGEAMDFEEPEPWPDPVDGAVLLDELTANARRYLVLPVGAAEAIALWTVHSHAHAPAEVSPLLAITSPTPECGKTTALTLLGSLVARPLPASNVTAAALFRAVERWHPTLLVDEADTFLRDSDDLRGIINSGHHRAGAYVVRTVGEDHEPRKFSTWAPKAVAMIGKLHPTLASRAVHVELRRKAAGEHVEPLRLDRLEHLVPLKRRAARWAADHMQALRRADPVMPDGLYGRAADNWRALLGIADAAGSEWPQRAREAARALTAGRAEETAGVLLLGDLRALFAQRKTEHLASAEIVSALAGMEDRPWPEWQRGQPITARQLARLLEPFGIRPGTRRDRTETFKGYTRAAFDDAFGRYLGISSVTPSQVSTGAGFRDFVPVTAADNVTDEEPLKPSTGAGCNGVTDRKPVAWGADV